MGRDKRARGVWLMCELTSGCLGRELVHVTGEHWRGMKRKGRQGECEG